MKTIRKVSIPFCNISTYTLSAADLNIPYRIAGAAIMGALVCQEIIKFYSHKDAPVTNFVALDASNLKNAAALL